MKHERLLVFLLVSLVFAAGCIGQPPKKDIVPPENYSSLTKKFSYLSDGLNISAIECYPNARGNFPIVILNHGGFSGIGPKKAEYCERLAKYGYAVFASSYRGEDNSEGEIEVAKGEVNDVVNLMDYAKKSTNTNPDKIGMVGFSHGGIITMLACERSNEIDAAVEHFAPYDLRNIQIPLQLKATVAGWTERDYSIRSPKTNISGLNCPLYIMHGDSDSVVPVSEAYAIANALKNSGKVYKIKIFNGGKHNFESEPQFTDIEFSETLSWLNEMLK